MIRRFVFVSLMVIFTSYPTLAAELEISSHSLSPSDQYSFIVGRESRLLIADSCLIEGSVCREGGESKGTCCPGLTCKPAGHYGSICESNDLPSRAD